MCGRYTQAKEDAVLRKRFNLERVEVKIKARYNIAPTQPVPVVLNDQGQRILHPCQWGLVPSWSKDPSRGASLINARGETVHQKPSFRTAFKRRRCIIPADGFYEWRKVGREKTPYYMTLPDHQVFGFAGIWEEWEGEIPGVGHGGPLRTCAIITTEANEKLNFVHPRMPVILHQKDEDLWLNTPETDAAQLLNLLKPYPDNDINLWPVSSKVNRVANDSPDNIDPFESELLF